MPKQILISDDDAGVRESLSLILGKDYELIFTKNGQECLEYLKEAKVPELILLDIKMPKISGLEILKQIKKLNPTQKVIIVTGYKTVETATEAIKAGALDYIVKPFQKQEILNKIKLFI